MSVQPPTPQAGAGSPLALTGPLTVGDLLDRAFRLYRARFGLFLLTAAVLLVPIAIISGIFLGGSFGGFMQNMGQFMTEATDPGDIPFSMAFDLFGGLYVSVLLLAVVSAAANAIVNLSLTAQAVETLHGGSLPLMAGLRRGVRRFLPYVGMMIVQYAAIAAASIVVLVPLVLAGLALVAAAGALFGGNPFESGGAGGILAAVGMVGLAICGYGLAIILVLVPSFYLLARWLVAPTALVAEGTGPIDALRRSWHLSQGNVLRMVGYLVLIYILMALFMSLPVMALQWAIMILMPTEALELAMTLPTAVSSLVSVFGLPFYVAAIVLLYYDLRIRRESYDLELRLAEMEEQVGWDAGARAMTTHFPLSGPMSAGDLLDRAFRLYRARFGVFLPTAAIFLVPAGILSVLFGEESIVGVLALFLEMAATALVSLAFTVQGIEALHSRPVTIGVGIRRGLSRFWPYVGMGIVQLAAFVAALLVGAIPFAIGMGVLGLLFGDGPENALDWIGGEGAFDIGSAAETIGLIICGIGPLFILFLAPFFYLYVRWYVSVVVLIAEGTGPIDSMRRSWHLSEGNFWRVFCYMFLLELLVSVLPLVIGPALEWSVAFIAPAAASGLLLRLVAAFPSLFLIISTPFRYGAGVLLYYDLRIRNEDYDLELRVAELEEQAARKADQQRVATDAISRSM